MFTKFSVLNPAMLASCGMLESYVKFTVVFDKTLESVSEIDGCNEIHAYTFRDDSLSVHSTRLGSPLIINCQIEIMGKFVRGTHFHLYIKMETDEAEARWENDIMSGPIDYLIERVVAKILNQLRHTYADDAE